MLKLEVGMPGNYIQWDLEGREAARMIQVLIQGPLDMTVSLVVEEPPGWAKHFVASQQVIKRSSLEQFLTYCVESYLRSLYSISDSS